MADPKTPSIDTAPKKIKESPLVILFSIIVLGLIGLALWISIDSVVEKIRVSNGLQQIISVVAMGRDAAKQDPHFATSDRRDLLDLLERMGRLKTDGTMDNIKTLNNAWGNSLTALVNADGNIRVETIVPPHICQRFIGSFGQNPQALGVKQVEVKGYYSSWRQIYTGTAGSTINEATIAAGCGDTVQADVALTFSLH